VPYPMIDLRWRMKVDPFLAQRSALR